MNDPVKVKPCPFCGSAATHYPRRHSDSWGWYNEYVTCTKCPARMGDPVHSRVESPLEKWNQRRRKPVLHSKALVSLTARSE